MFAMKDNRQTKITEDEKQKYIDRGYKIAKLVKGELVYEEVETEDSKEIEELKKKINDLESELEKAKKVEGAKVEDEKEKKSKKEDK